MNDIFSILQVAGGLLLTTIILIALLTTTLFSLFGMIIRDLKNFVLRKHKTNVIPFNFKTITFRHLTRVSNTIQHSK